MDARAFLRFAAVLAAAALATPAPANILYKSIAPNGTITFSDFPPEGAAKVEKLRMGESGVTASVRDSIVAVTNLDQLREADDAVARANARVDLAEHALALARRSLWSHLDGLRLASSRDTSIDAARVEFFKRDVLLARQSLLEILQQRNSK